MKRYDDFQYLLCILLCLSVWGCANPKSVIVLMPDHQGEVGEIQVSNASGSQRASQAQEAIFVRDADTQPESPVLLDREEIDELFGEVLNFEPEQPAEYRIFFLNNATLMPDSQAQISEVVRETMRRESCNILITGHTDLVGKEEFNIKLSQRRIATVRQLIISAGVNPECIETEAYTGQFPLVLPASENTAQLGNRRVEVFVK